MEAQNQITRRIAVQRLPANPVIFFLAGSEIHHTVLPFVRTINDVRIARVRHDWPSFAAGTGAPVVTRCWISLTGNNDRRVVLLGAVKFVRKLIVDPNAVDLRGGLVQLRRPRSATVGRNIRAAVVRLNQRLTVFRIDPDVVVITMRRAEGGERAPAVSRFEETFGAPVHHICVCWIGAQCHVIKRPLNQSALRIDQLPGLTRVF